jgi:hypothetical protein
LPYPHHSPGLQGYGEEDQEQACVKVAAKGFVFLEEDEG